MPSTLLSLFSQISAPRRPRSGKDVSAGTDPAVHRAGDAGRSAVISSGLRVHPDPLCTVRRRAYRLALQLHFKADMGLAGVGLMSTSPK